MNAPSPETAPGHRGLPRSRLLLAVVVVGLLAAVAVPFYTMSRMGAGSRPITEAELAALSAGQTVDVALEITRVIGDASFEANLLERAEQGVYRRTGQSLQVRWRPDTPVVMGKREDVRAGAILQARGRVARGGMVDADRLVILTGNVVIR